VRVYFNLVRGNETIRDGEGMDVADLDQAVLDVMDTLRELKRTDPSRSASWKGWTVHVTDENGIAIVTLPLSTTTQ
jgi:hypothetical protein